MIFGLILLILHGNLINGRPNIVLIFADDMGYGDLHSYGHPTQEYGAIDDLAAEGVRFTQWYSADSLCTPSRAALLTGSLPIRSGMVGPRRVLHVDDAGGLPKNETTIAEALREQGYSTGMVGKWHLGNEVEQNDGRHLPCHHGFDYVGTILPFTFHFLCDPKRVRSQRLKICDAKMNVLCPIITQSTPQFSLDKMKTKCFLTRNTSIIQQPIVPETMTQQIVDDVKYYITKNKQGPFFLYMSLPQLHSAMMCNPQFCNKSKRGIYGDNLNEMAWAVGEVVRLLRQLQIDRNTLVLFISDNGPALELCFHGGSSGFLKGGKATTWDGGIRIPAIAWWPGKIQPGINTQVLSSMDVFPTLLQLAGGNGRNNGNLDGKSIADLLLGNHDTEIHKILFHYCSDRLMAVRFGKYKIHYHTQPLPRYGDNCPDGNPIEDLITGLGCYENTTTHKPPLIYNIETDPGETHLLDPSNQQNVLEEVEARIKAHKATIVPVKSQLGNSREILKPCCNPPTCVCNYPASVTKKTEL
uniref:Sulfatase N-terminal domain-containing protein n=1 Tax=Ciona savignyi TaxID=51511 RepID=H2YNE5_CIOSA